MRNTLILLVLIAIIGLIPWMVSRNKHTATVRGTFPDELTGVDYNWVYLHCDEEVLDSCIIADNRFELTAEVNDQRRIATVMIPCCSLTQQVTIRPRHEIAIRVSLDEYYRKKAEMTIIETMARLDSSGVSLPDSIWNQLRDSLVKAFIELNAKQ